MKYGRSSQSRIIASITNQAAICSRSISFHLPILTIYVRTWTSACRYPYQAVGTDALKLHALHFNVNSIPKTQPQTHRSVSTQLFTEVRNFWYFFQIPQQNSLANLHRQHSEMSRINFHQLPYICLYGENLITVATHYLLICVLGQPFMFFD